MLILKQDYSDALQGVLQVQHASLKLLLLRCNIKKKKKKGQSLMKHTTLGAMPRAMLRRFFVLAVGFVSTLL